MNRLLMSKASSKIGHLTGRPEEPTNNLRPVLERSRNHALLAGRASAGKCPTPQTPCAGSVQAVVGFGQVRCDVDRMLLEAGRDRASARVSRGSIPFEARSGGLVNPQAGWLEGSVLQAFKRATSPKSRLCVCLDLRG